MGSRSENIRPVVDAISGLVGDGSVRLEIGSSRSPNETLILVSSAAVPPQIHLCNRGAGGTLVTIEIKVSSVRDGDDHMFNFQPGAMGISLHLLHWKW